MENLSLPHLTELFLHRNNIRVIENLQCPRLRKLWLSQNQLTSISGLQNVPELQELWLHGNMIRSTQGVECCAHLQHLGLAGNPISDFSELNALASCTSLLQLTCSDVHFGRCPIVEDEGYISFLRTHLPQLRIIDSVKVTSTDNEMYQAMNLEVTLLEFILS